jgi:hypothetical protein
MRVRWSNGYAQRVELPVLMGPGGKYVVKQFEGEPPKPPARPLSVGEGMAAGAAAGAIEAAALYTAPFWLPPALMIWAFSPKPTAPPESHGMIVWVEGENGRSVAEWKSEWGSATGVALTPVE